MSAVTYYVALPIILGEEGELLPGEAVEMPSEQAARSRAAALAAKYAGAIAFSRSGDPSTGEFEPAVILARYGDLPAEIADAIGGGA